MIICLGILIFIIGCCLSASAADDERYERNAERRHRELVEELRKQREHEKRSSQTKCRVRTMLRDEKGRFIAQEVIEDSDDE